MNNKTRKDKYIDFYFKNRLELIIKYFNANPQKAISKYGSFDNISDVVKQILTRQYVDKVRQKRYNRSTYYPD